MNKYLAKIASAPSMLAASPDIVPQTNPGVTSNNVSTSLKHNLGMGYYALTRPQPSANFSKPDFYQAAYT